MAFDTEKKKTITDVIQVVREGTKLIVPDGVPLERVREALDAKIAYDETEVAVTGTVDGFINEGTYAFYKVLVEKFGYAQSVPIPSFFGNRPPMLRTIPIALGEYVQVPWGRFELPGVEGWIQTGAEFKDGRFLFQVQALVKRKYEDIIQELVKLTQERVKSDPIYGKKAFRIRLRADAEEGGEILENPEPKFIPINTNILNELVFSDEVKAAITTSIFTPIRHTDLVRKVQGSLKRGILLSGKFGTGKSMTSAATAYLATTNGWTFIVCERADELAEVLRLAKDYGPCVVFCEDIDRVMQGDRSIDMDEILNVIDGVESKSVELMVVLTTNYVENINQAMLRPGRLDAIINVTAPDAAAVERLIRQYGRGLVPTDLNITDIGEKMAGNIPAVIREMVERAKLAAIDSNPDYESLVISHDDLVSASHSMRNQLELLAERVVDTRPVEVQAADTLGAHVAGLSAPLNSLASILSGETVVLDGPAN